MDHIRQPRSCLQCVAARQGTKTTQQAAPSVPYPAALPLRGDGGGAAPSLNISLICIYSPACIAGSSVRAASVSRRYWGRPVVTALVVAPDDPFVGPFRPSAASHNSNTNIFLHMYHLQVRCERRRQVLGMCGQSIRELGGGLGEGGMTSGCQRFSGLVKRVSASDVSTWLLLLPACMCGGTIQERLPVVGVG